MTFPNTLHTPVSKDTSADEIVNPQFYINGVDVNQINAEIFGIEVQLGLSKKLDLTVSVNTLQIAGPAQSTIGGIIVSIPGGSITFIIAGVFFVWVDSFGVLFSGASLPTTSNYLPIAQVVCGVGGTIISFVDLRPWLNGTGGGGSGSFPANYRATTTEPRYARRDVIVLAATDFLPAGLIPLSSSAYFDIDIVTSIAVEVTIFQIEGINVTPIILGTTVAGVNKRFRVQAPKNYDGSVVDIEYQMQVDFACTVEFLGIMEIDFDALLESTPASLGGTELIPFQVAFLFSDISPVVLFNMLAGDVLTECEVIIQTVFNTVSATLEVGVIGDLGAVLDSGEIDADVVGQYATIADRTSAIADNLLLTITPSGSTSGSGYVSGIIRR